MKISWKKIWKKVRPVLDILIIVLVFYFIAKVLYDNWQKLLNYQWNINYFYLILALLLHTVSFFLLGISWGKILHFITGKEYDFKKTARIFFIAQIVRYIPGNIWSFIQLAIKNEEKLEISKPHTILAIIVEIVIRMAVGALISIIVLVEIFHRYSLVYYVVLVLTILLAVFVLYSPRNLNKVLNFFLLKKGQKFLIHTTFDYKKVSLLVFYFSLHWLIFGVGLFVLIKALGIHEISILRAIGVDIVSWIGGYLSLITPSGVGVREGIMIALFTPITGLAIATVISIVARLFFTLGELINLGFILIWTRSEKNSH